MSDTWGKLANLFHLGQEFLSLPDICICSVIHPAAYAVGRLLGILSTWVKHLELEAYHISPSTAKIMNVWRCISTVTYAFILWCFKYTIYVSFNIIICYNTLLLQRLSPLSYSIFSWIHLSILSGILLFLCVCPVCRLKASLKSVIMQS
jgi:hypothetical protein